MNHIICVCGDSASGKTQLSQHLHKWLNDSIILECDRYHKWERDDYRWKYFTHLNPYANDIDGMINDLKQLEENKIIHKHDYDHSKGKFTDIKEIKPYKYIIASGLHTSFFNPLKGIKIYIDTEKDLKVIWKMERDFKERGYKTEQIIKKISERESDYKNFIEPQCKKCDLIIKFYLDESKNISNKIYLKDSYLNNHRNSKIEFNLLLNYNYNTVPFLVENLIHKKKI